MPQEERCKSLNENAVLEYLENFTRFSKTTGLKKNQKSFYYYFIKSREGKKGKAYS